jgi:hypothetical protein
MRTFSTHGEVRNAYRMLVRKREGKRPLGRCTCGWEDDIKINVKEIEGVNMDWINLA